MKKAIVLFSFLGLWTYGMAQPFTPESFSLSYFGEMGTHPGLRLSATYALADWQKQRNPSIKKSFLLESSVGFFYHRRYQTALFFLPELELAQMRPNGRTFGFGLGLGYLRTFVPNTFEVEDDGRVNKTPAGHQYLLSSVFIAFERPLGSVHFFIKPELLYAVPNFPKGVGYFAFEFGVKKGLK